MTNIVLCQQFAPTTVGNAFTASSATIIDAAVVCNPTGSPDTLSVWVAQDGGTQGADNAIYHELAVDAGATVVLGALQGMSLVTGADLYLQAGSSATALAVTVTGRR